MSTLAPPRPAPLPEQAAPRPKRPVPRPTAGTRTAVAGAKAGTGADAQRASLRQMIVGLIALPLTLLPFIAYATMTPEGRLVRDRALVALFPPSLPELSIGQKAAALAAAPRYEGAVMALAYHGIGSASDGEGGFVISPKRFGEHLATLKAAGMNAVTAADVAAAFEGGPALPPNAVMISFDDGRSDAMMFADPLLRQAEMSATMFVIAGSAAKPGIYYASWDRIASYAKSGRWDIQSHTTASHREHKADGGGSLPALTSRARGESLDAYRARVRQDLAKAAQAILEHIGRRPVAFAYPFGAYGADRTNDPAIAQIVREEVEQHYALAFQQDDQETVPLLTSADDRLRLRRLEVGDWSGTELLKRIDRAQRQSASQPASTGPTLASDPAPAAQAPGAAAMPGQAAGSAGQVGGGAAASGGAPAGVNPVGATPARVNVPAPTVPGATGAPVPAVSPPATTVTVPVTSPPATTPPSTVVTTTPTTRPPTTSPPTTVRPPTTSPPTTPPTTTCQPVGNSGKCAPGQGRG